MIYGSKIVRFKLFEGSPQIRCFLPKTKWIFFSNCTFYINYVSTVQKMARKFKMIMGLKLYVLHYSNAYFLGPGIKLEGACHLSNYIFSKNSKNYDNFSINFDKFR
jgi:hypothetical protein